MYTLIPDGYVQEALEPAPRTPDLLLRIEHLLETKVWNRPALPSSSEIDWKDCLKEYGVIVPDYAIPTEFCLVHGDPTASNTLVRGDDLILCDPRPPRNYIPQCRETDMSRILQSLLNWEVVAYGSEYVPFDWPKFMNYSYLYPKVQFWCGATAARIEHLERSRGNCRHILDWCLEIRGMFHV